MRYVFACVEQLDRAAQELRVESPITGRLALILTDNIVELISHNSCAAILSPEWMLRNILPLKYPMKVRREVLGQFFDKKVKFLRSHKRISQEELEFILIAHRYRNEAYHTGLVHDDIIYTLSWHYHDLACRLFGRLEPSYYSYGSNEHASDVVKKHIARIGQKGRMNAITDLPKASASIAKERPPLKSNFASVLADSLQKRIDTLEWNIAFIVRDSEPVNDFETLTPGI